MGPGRVPTIHLQVQAQGILVLVSVAVTRHQTKYTVPERVQQGSAAGAEPMIHHRRAAKDFRCARGAQEIGDRDRFWKEYPARVFLPARPEAYASAEPARGQLPPPGLVTEPST